MTLPNLKTEFDGLTVSLDTSSGDTSFVFKKEDVGYYIFSNNDMDSAFDYNASELINKIKNKLKKSTAGYFTDVVYSSI